MKQLDHLVDTTEKIKQREAISTIRHLAMRPRLDKTAKAEDIFEDRAALAATQIGFLPCA